MLLSGTREQMRSQLLDILAGYEDFHTFDPRELFARLFIFKAVEEFDYPLLRKARLTPDCRISVFVKRSQSIDVESSRTYIAIGSVLAGYRELITIQHAGPIVGHQLIERLTQYIHEVLMPKRASELRGLTNPFFFVISVR